MKNKDKAVEPPGTAADDKVVGFTNYEAQNNQNLHFWSQTNNYRWQLFFAGQTPPPPNNYQDLIVGFNRNNYVEGAKQLAMLTTYRENIQQRNNKKDNLTCANVELNTKYPQDM